MAKKKNVSGGKAKNFMQSVLCPKNGNRATPANSTKTANVMRCTKCGATGHELAK